MIAIFFFWLAAMITMAFLGIRISTFGFAHEIALDHLSKSQIYLWSHQDEVMAKMDDTFLRTRKWMLLNYAFLSLLLFFALALDRNAMLTWSLLLTFSFALNTLASFIISSDRRALAQKMNHDGVDLKKAYEDAAAELSAGFDTMMNGINGALSKPKN